MLEVDFDPEVVRTQQHHGMNTRFSDGDAPGFVESLPLADVPWVVSTLPDHTSNRALLHALSLNYFKGHIAIVARDEAEAARLAHFDQVVMGKRDQSMVEELLPDNVTKRILAHARTGVFIASHTG